MTEISVFASAAALRSRLALQPIGGPRDHVFPPIYAAGPDDGSKHPRYAVEPCTLDDRTALRVLVDSVASQANRQEQALVAARRSGRIAFPDLVDDLSGTRARQEALLVTELPHRLADAVVRDSEIDGVGFARSEFGSRIVSSGPQDLTPILEASPTTLLFGAWFSQWQLAHPLRLQRLTSSDVWAHDATLGLAVSSRIDPLGLERMDIFEAEDGAWTVDPEEAVRDDKGKPKRHAKSKTSALNHGNILPEIHQQGITAERYELTWMFSTAALRRLSFGGPPERRAARDSAAQNYLLALGILARVLAHEEGYSLRSRCDLLPTSPFVIELLPTPLVDENIVTVPFTSADAIALFETATAAAREAGLELDGTPDRKPVLVPRGGSQR